MPKNTKQVSPSQFGILPQPKSLFGSIVWVHCKHWWDKDDSKSEGEKTQQFPCGVLDFELAHKWPVPNTPKCAAYKLVELTEVGGDDTEDGTFWMKELPDFAKYYHETLEKKKQDEVEQL